jgi:hypothetical protein
LTGSELFNTRPSIIIISVWTLLFINLSHYYISIII